MQNFGDNNLDDVELRNQFWNAAPNSFLPGSDDVLKGYAFEVIGAAPEGTTRFNELVYNGDWVVWSADSFTTWSDTDNWFVIAGSNARRITAPQARFLQQITETDTPAPTQAISRARIWLLETRPLQAPLLRDGQTGSFTSSTQLNDRIVLIAVPNTLGINDLVFQDQAPDGAVTHFDVSDQFIDYAPVIPDNSNGSYYLLGSAIDSERLYRLFPGHTITIRQREVNREFTASSFVNLTPNIENLQLRQLDPSVQVTISAGNTLTNEQLAKLSALNTQSSTNTNTNAENLLVKIGEPSIVETDYQMIANSNGIVPNFQAEMITILTRRELMVSQLSRTGANNPVQDRGILTLSGTSYNSYTSNLPASSNPLNDTWRVSGEIVTHTLDGVTIRDTATGQLQRITVANGTISINPAGGI